MISYGYIRHHLRGALQLFTGNAEGMDHFDLTERGYWNSFFALGASLALLVPSFMATHQLRVFFADQSPELEFATPLPVFVVTEWVAAAVGWLSFLYVMRWIARAFGSTSRYGAWVVAYNWCSFFGVLLLLPMNVAAVLGIVSWDIAVLLEFMIGLMLLVYFWFVHKTALNLKGLDATAVLFLEIFIALLFAQATGLINSAYLSSGTLQAMSRTLDILA